MTTGEIIIGGLVIGAAALITYKLNKIMTDLTAITQEVSETNTVMASAVTLIQGLKEKLDAAGTDEIKLRELSESLDMNANNLARAITENTPANGEQGGAGGENTAASGTISTEKVQ